MSERSNLRTTWRLLRPFALPRLPLLLAVGLMGSVVAFSQALSIMLIEPLFRDVLFGETARPEDGEEAAALIGSLFDWSRNLGAEWTGVEDPRVATLVAVVAILAVAGIAGGICQFGVVWLSRWVSLRMVVDLRIAIARHLVGLSLRYHGKRPFGDLLSRVSADVNTTLVSVEVALRNFIQEPVYIAVLGGSAIAISPRVGLISLAAVPLLAVPIGLLSKRIRRGSTRSATTLGSSVQALSEMFQGIRTVKAFRAEERELARYRELNDNYVQTAMRMVRAIALTRGSTHFLALFGFAVLLLIVGLISMDEPLFANAGRMSAFFILIAQVFQHIKSLSKSMTQVQESVGAAERLQEILAEPVDVVEPAAPRAVSDLGDGIHLDEVTFTYADAETPALAGVDLHVRPGETLALVGASGAGKSTLVDLVCRFFDPSEGRIRVGEVDLREISLDDWTSLYAMVGQVPFLFRASIAENIRYGKPEATDAEVEAAARAANIHDWVSALPQGYDTPVGDGGELLSGGQRQRVTIARALLKGAPLLLLDEATSALDSESEKAVQEALDALMRDRTVIVIAHRLSTIRDADRIAVLEAGRLVELGSHDELVGAGGVYARLHSLQQLAPA